MSKLKDRALWFHLVAALALAVLLVWVHMNKVERLSAPSSPPPPGLHISWAGAPIDGYAESVITHVTNCTTPALVAMILYPAIGRPWRPRAAGKVAFAVSGEPPSDRLAKMRILRIFSSTVPLGPPTRMKVTIGGQVSWAGQIIASAYSFLFDPRAQRYLNVELEADWLFPRESKGSCWVDLPSLLGVNESYVVANKAVGPLNATSSQSHAPLYTAGNYLKDEVATVRPNISASIPVPSSLGELEWGCRIGNESGDNCQAFASLEAPGAEASRSSQLSQWSVAEGLLLGFLGSVLLELAHLVFRISHRNSSSS